MNQGKVLCGGSAGAICWFDSGHSDSADPFTFHPSHVNPDVDATAWQYIRVPGLGLLPGLCCPHHDSIQSNGVPRKTDVDQMLLRHPGERCICLDNNSAIIVEGDEYRLFAFGRDENIGPVVWSKEVQGTEVVATRVPNKGRVSDLFVPAKTLQPDPTCDKIRALNYFPG